MIASVYIDMLKVSKIKAYYKLLKPRLSFLSAFSGAFGYILASETIHWWRLALFALAGFLLSGASVAVNQIIERDYDVMMKRTQNRPIPAGKIGVFEANMYSVVLLLISCYILFFEFNFNTGWVALLSFILYSVVYTPLKRVGPIAVFVGAFPGAFPPMIGWLAATGQFGWEPGILFAIQFFWQFPHFFAIAWVSDEDYRRAGFRLLPNGGKKDLNTAFQMMIYTLFLIPLSFIPYKLGMTGINSAIVAMFCGVIFLAQTFYLMKKVNDKAALLTMFGSFIYLPIVQIAFLLDKV